MQTPSGWMLRRTVTRQPFGTSTVNCLCSDCKALPGSRVSIAHWDAHAGQHRALGVDPAAAPPATATKDDAARSATLTWTPPADDGGRPVTGYRVSRDGTDSNNTGAWSSVLPADARAITFMFLVPNFVYTLSVQAVTAAGNGAAARRTAQLSPAPPTGGPNMFATPLDARAGMDGRYLSADVPNDGYGMEPGEPG